MTHSSDQVIKRINGIDKQAIKTHTETVFFNLLHHHDRFLPLKRITGIIEPDYR